MATSRRSFFVGLGVILLVGLVLRVGYVTAQPATDPAFDRPHHDGAYYLDWARSIADGTASTREEFAGAFYLAPLYPHLLALELRAGGESFARLYLVQHLLILVAAGWIAVGMRRPLGDAGALGAAALFLLYHPLLFFASRPLGEALGVFLLVAAIQLAQREGYLSPALGGLLAGAAALARPNFLLVPALWFLGELAQRRPKRALLILGGVAIALVPSTVRNYVASGHFVPVSSNAGLTLYHGNGPCAEGLFQPARGFSGELRAQRTEATLIARLETGEADLDPVEADRWFGRQAVRERLAGHRSAAECKRESPPPGTALLLLLRLFLTLDDTEHGLDYAPRIDANPWRFGAPVPFALLLGLATLAAAARGLRGSGGWVVWGAVLACAATPLIFYVSSRYRLPASVLLALPAGRGISVLLESRGHLGRLRRPLLVGISCAVLSLILSWSPGSRGLERIQKADALAVRGQTHRGRGDLERALRDVERARSLAPEGAMVLFAYARVAEDLGRTADAETAYRESLRVDPGRAAAAGNLASILIRTGRPGEAIPMLERALLDQPLHSTCWTNLVLAFHASGHRDAALRSIQEAQSKGVVIDPGLVAAVSAGEEASP